MLGKQSFFCFLKTKMRRRCEKVGGGEMKGFGGGREKSWGAKNKHSVIPGAG